MKNKYSVILAFCFSVSLAFPVSNQSQNPQWKGTIEEKDGVKVNNNPNEPLYGEIKFDLEEDLSIGNEEDENYLFYRVRDVNVDSQGNIYVVDMSNYRVQKFNRNGKYLQTIGRAGQGPGEFGLIKKVRIDNNSGNIYVLDSVREIEIFVKQGDPFKTLKLEKVPQDFRIDNEGNIIGVFMFRAAPYSKIVSSKPTLDLDFVIALYKSNLKGAIIGTFAEYPYKYFMYRGQQNTVGGFRTGYEEDLYISKIDEQSFVFGYSGKYELHVIDNNGQRLFIVRREVLPRELPKPRRKELRKLGLDSQPFFFLILSDSEGRIYVQRNKTWNEEQSVKKEIDIFDSDGCFLYQTFLPHNTFVIKNGYLYALVLDENEGMEYVKRYKIKNWEQIKTGI